MLLLAQGDRRPVSAREAETAAPWRRDPDGAPLYPSICRDLGAAEAGRRIAAGAVHAWRLDIAAALAAASPLAYRRLAPDAAESVVAARPERWGDTVMARKEVPTSYHLSVVLDDAVQGVTHVVRGQTSRPRPICTCCCRISSACRRRATATTR